MSAKDFAEPIIGQIVVLVVVLLLAWFTSQFPLIQPEPFITVSLTICSILFGFLTVSMMRHLEEIRKIKQIISDQAKELLELIEKVSNNQNLMNKIIHYDPKYWHYGFEGTSYSGKAISTIKMAYDYLIMSVRQVTHITRGYVLFWKIPGLIFLFITIVISILSKIDSFNLNIDMVYYWNIASILFGGFITIIGWWGPDRKIEQINDAIINIRHSILKDLFR